MKICTRDGCTQPAVPDADTPDLCRYHYRDREFRKPNCARCHRKAMPDDSLCAECRREEDAMCDGCGSAQCIAGSNLCETCHHEAFVEESLDDCQSLSDLKSWIKEHLL